MSLEVHCLWPSELLAHLWPIGAGRKTTAEWPKKGAFLIEYYCGKRNYPCMIYWFFLFALPVQSGLWSSARSLGASPALFGF
jgi:hypothetical protein